MKTLLIALVFILPLSAQAMCEREETLYANSVDLYIKTKKLNENSKKLFEQKQLSAEKLVESFTLLKRTFNMVIKSQHLYYECQARIMV